MSRRPPAGRRHRVALAALLAVLAGLAFWAGGCRGTSRGSSPTADGAAATSSPAAADIAPSTPAATQTIGRCPQARPHAVGSSDVTLPSGRHYILHVPPGYDGTRALPLVINLHGAGSSAREQAFYSGFQAKADREGFITLTPDATGTPQAWNFIPLASGSDDVGFIREALDRAQAELCVDPSRVFSTGISSGAAMSVRLACSLPDRIAAIGVVAAIWYPPQCAADAMPVLEFHGTADPVVPFTGGKVATSGIPSPAVEDAVAQWAKADGCPAQPAGRQISPHVRSETYAPCRGNAAVELVAIEGGGHTWPGASVGIPALGETTKEISATDQIWDFFAAHAR